MLAYTTYIAFGGGILGLPLIRSFLWPFMFLLLSKHRVPITGRRQLLHRDAEHILMGQNRKTQWYLDFVSRPRVSVEDPLTKAVQAAVDQLSTAHAVGGHDFKLVVCHDICTDTFTATAFPDGTVFMSTSQLSECYKLGQVGAILAHEMGHLVARHTAERFSHDLMANEFAELFGSDGPMSNTLAMSRLQELEADYIGLMLMSEIGFDPQDAVEYLKDQESGSWKSLTEKTPLSRSVEGESNGHPSMKERIAALELIMPQAKMLFERSGTSNPVIHLEWTQIRENYLERET